MLANDRPWLLTWELGDWLGHLRGLFALAQARARHGGQSVILTPAGTKVPEDLCGHRGIRWRESAERAVSADGAASWSYPQIMQAQGMADGKAGGRIGFARRWPHASRAGMRSLPMKVRPTSWPTTHRSP